MKIIGVIWKHIFNGPITIGENCFIGARITLLPNTIIGDNCIIGSGAVVKGGFESNSIIVGNPAKTICTIDEWIDKHLKRLY